MKPIRKKSVRNPHPRNKTQIRDLDKFLYELNLQAMVNIYGPRILADYK